MKLFNPIPILRWMGEQRLSLTDMEKLTGLTRCTLHNVLNAGKSPSWETFVILHRVTGIDPIELILKGGTR